MRRWLFIRLVIVLFLSVGCQVIQEQNISTKSSILTQENKIEPSLHSSEESLEETVLSFDLASSPTIDSRGNDSDLYSSFKLLRIEIPWRGPPLADVDTFGFSLPIGVGDVDRDGRNEVLVHLLALDGAALSCSKTMPALRVLPWQFEWREDRYVLEEVPCIRSSLPPFTVRWTGQVSVVDWGDRTIFLIGANPTRANRYGALTMIDLDDWKRTFHETLCFGAVYRLDPVVLDGEPAVFASSVSNYRRLIGRPDLKACPNYEDIVRAGPAARNLVLVQRETNRFSFQIIASDSNDTLLISRLPDKSGALYYLATNRDEAGDSLVVKVWQNDDSAFVPVEKLIEDWDTYLLAIKGVDLDGDGLFELAILHSTNKHIGRNDLRSRGVQDVRLTVYHWTPGGYQQEWEHFLDDPTWELFAGDIDNDGDSEIVTNQGLIVDLREGVYRTDHSLIQAMGQKGLFHPGEPDLKFWVADPDSDQKNELLVLAEVERVSLSADVEERVTRPFLGAWPPEGVFYLYVIENQTSDLQ